MRTSLESTAVSLQVFDFVIARPARFCVRHVDKVFHSKIPWQKSRGRR